MKRIFNCLLAISTILLLSACAVSPETQVLIDEFNSTIPTCDTTSECNLKWNAARDWVTSTPSYPIRVSSEDRIETYDADTTRAGTAIQVTRESPGNGRYQLVVNIDCFANRGCPPYWPTMVDFNRTVNAVGSR